jgi:hypothetical protein
MHLVKITENYSENWGNFLCDRWIINYNNLIYKNFQKKIKLIKLNREKKKSKKNYIINDQKGK